MTLDKLYEKDGLAQDDRIKTALERELEEHTNTLLNTHLTRSEKYHLITTLYECLGLIIQQRERAARDELRSDPE